MRSLLHTRTRYDNLTETTGYWGGPPMPTISRDGRYVAYTSNWEGSGRYDLFVARIEPAPRLAQTFEKKATTSPRRGAAGVN